MDTAAWVTRGIFLQAQLESDGSALILAGLAAAALGAGDIGVFLFEHLFGAGHVAQAIAFAEMRVGFFGHERAGDGFHDGYSFWWIVKERKSGTKKPPGGRLGNNAAKSEDETISVRSAARRVLQCANHHTLETSILPLPFLTSLSVGQPERKNLPKSSREPLDALNPQGAEGIFGRFFLELSPAIFFERSSIPFCFCILISVF